MKTYGILCVIILVFPSVLMAQRDIDSGVGRDKSFNIAIVLGAARHMHEGSFGTPEFDEERGEFGKGAGIGPLVGTRVDIPLARSVVFSPRVLGECLTGEFTSSKLSLPIVGHNMEPDVMTVEQRLDANIKVLTVDLPLAWVFGGSGLYVVVGPSLSLAVSEYYELNESIVQPSGVSYLDGTTETKLFTGDLDLTRKMQIGLRGGFGYNFPVSTDIKIGLELLFHFALSNMHESGEWNRSAVLLSTALLFTL